MKRGRMRYCFNCGEPLGEYADYDPLDTCGKAACNREANNAAREERRQAHEDLDRERGWS